MFPELLGILSECLVSQLGSSSKIALSSIAHDQFILPCHRAVLIFKRPCEEIETQISQVSGQECGIILVTGSQCLAVLPL